MLSEGHSISLRYPIRGASWTADPDVFCIIAASVLFRPSEKDEEMGVIGYDYHGYIRNIPISSSVSLRRTGRLVLAMSTEGRDDVTIGSVKVLDMPEYGS